MQPSLPSPWKTLGRLTAACLVLGLLGGAAEAQDAGKPLKPRRVTSFQQLKQLLSSKSIRANYAVNRVATTMNTAELAAGGQPADVAHSDTNVQVRGVDEGDTVKTDGHYIYSIQNNQVRIVDAYPPKQMALAATLQFDEGFYPTELYVQGDRLVVVGQGWRADENAGPVADELPRMAIWRPAGESLTMARVYNVADRASPSLEREISISGSYLASRRLGNSLYLTARKYPSYFFRDYLAVARKKGVAAGGPALTRENTLPRVQDSAADDGKEQALPLQQLYYFPGFVEPDYVTVVSFRLDEPERAADVKSYLGAGDIVYASSNHLFLSAADYSAVDASNEVGTIPVTHIYKFALKDGATEFRQAGEVPGVPLNQFSLDEHQGYFRIATTVDRWTWDGATSQNQSWNNLYTLDPAMKLVGRLEHLAEGERIYAARFMEERAYLVTFAQTDPLFVIDLSMPEAPKLLGELKIPGFSNYLHPYDADHVIGIGQEVATDGNDGFTQVQGVKLALFDVSDPAHPKETHSLVIGDQGTYSPAQYDHKAILFDPARHLLGFPIEETAMTAKDPWPVPVPVFQGAQLYEIDLVGGFRKIAAVTHQDDAAYYDWYHYVQRLLTIGDQLYTLSEARLQANDLATLKTSGRLDFPLEQPDEILYRPVILKDAVAQEIGGKLLRQGSQALPRQ
ncbi:MAG: hypothetical protein EPN21_16675 [Methylococcaceae bacterium]|nr:MAG: hypothetical protein EPN21_16675 [Methylococcaceae bacterium]